MRSALLVLVIAALPSCATQPPTPEPGHPAHMDTGAATAPHLSGVLKGGPAPVPLLPVSSTDPTPKSPELHAGPSPPLPDVGPVGGLTETPAETGERVMEHQHERR